MLAPSNRLTLIDAMRPPMGFQLESAMAVTFTLNLQSLLAVPAAFTIAGQGDGGGERGGARPVELIHALRANAGKLTVFSEAGHISLPPPSRAFGFLEQAVVPVKAPRAGIVHPKVWVLRYQQIAAAEADGLPEERLRVLIASRNLTFDTSWDTVLRLDEMPHPGGAELGAVGELFSRLLETPVGEVSHAHRARVRSLVESLLNARFALPEGVDEIRVHLLGFGGNKGAPFPDDPERSLIISPFLADGFFADVYPGPVDTLVSRQGSLDETSEQILARIGSKWVFDDGSTSEALGHTVADSSISRRQEQLLSPGDPGRPLRGLHAKVFAFEKGKRAHLFIGSANATQAAFTSNVETLAELVGPLNQLGIDRLLAGDEDQPGLDALLHVYHRNPDGRTDDDGTRDLDRIRGEVARMKIEGTVEASGPQSQEWAVTYRSDGPLPGVEGVQISCWPVTTPGHKRRVDATQPLEARFDTSLERISGFLAFEIAHDGGGQTGFVVPVQLVGVPEHRDRRLLRVLIGDARRFLRYLLALLYEDNAPGGLEGVIRQFEESDGSTGGSAIGLAVLEELLRTMRSDPSKLAGLHPLIADLSEDNALPSGFAELWATIYQVAIRDAAHT